MKNYRRSSGRHLSIASRATGLLLATASFTALSAAQAQTAGAAQAQTSAPAEQSTNQFQQDAASVKGRTQAATGTESRATGDTGSNGDIIVTGVSTATNARKASVSYSVLTEEDMSKFTPISADDMLRDMPGVVVESNDGVARNEVFTRGMTIGTGSNTSGYFWSTVLEDGLPTVPFKFGGFQDGYFYRADIATARVEAVRGGSSAIGVSTSVGAAFNYITGMPKPGVAAQIRVGFEGEDTHLSWRQADIAIGWQNRNKDFGLGLSGFYRASNGQVDPGYDLNRGGQVRLNVRKEYLTDNGSGAFNIIFKHLDDTNAELTTFQQPAYGYQSPDDIPGFGRDVNLFLAGGNQTVPNYFREGTHTLTPQDGYRYKQDALSLSWNHAFDSGLSLNAAMRFQKTSARGQQYKTGGIQSLASSVTLRERFGMNIANLDRTPGFYELYNDAGALVARVANNVAGSQLGVDYRTGLACPRVAATTFQTNPSSLCVTLNNLPNANIDLRGGRVTGTVQNTSAAVIAQYGPFTSVDLPLSALASRDLVLLTQAEDTNRSSKDFSGVFSLNYKTPSLNYNFSIYAAHAQQVSEAWSNGRGVSAWADDQVRNLNVRYVTNTGTTYQLTDPAGWGYYGTGSFGTYTRRASITEFSPFTTLNFSPDEHWDFNAGVKYQYIRADTYSENWNIRNAGATLPTFGGLDNNPLTVYDNLYNVINPAQVIRASRDVSTFNYTAAVGYNFNRDHKVYVRWTDAKNAAAGIVERYQSAATLTRPLGPTAFVRGIEAAYSFNTRMFNGQITYFRQKFSVNDFPTGVDVDNTTTYLLPETDRIYITEGVEAWARFRVARSLEWTPSVTYAAGKTLRDPVWLNTGANGLGPADDILRIDSGILARTPKWTISNVVSYKLGDFRLNARHRLMDRRKLNVNTLDTRYLPKQDNLDLSVQYEGWKNTRITLDVRNVTDTQYISSYDAILQSNLPSGIQAYDVVQQLPESAFLLKRNAPRSYWLTIRRDFR